jgi:hypothetical protein
MSYLAVFKSMYATHLNDVRAREARVVIGLQKLLQVCSLCSCRSSSHRPSHCPRLLWRQGGADVEEMKQKLARDEIELHNAEASCEVILRNLQTQAFEGKKESAAVSKIKDACEVRRCVGVRFLLLPCTTAPTLPSLYFCVSPRVR